MEKRKEEPRSCRVGGATSASKALWRKLTVTSSRVLARCTLSCSTFCGPAEEELQGGRGGREEGEEEEKERDGDPSGMGSPTSL